MLYYLYLIPLGAVIGAFGTMIGAGGGFVLMPLLLLLYPKASPEAITSISLAVVFFNALSGSWAYARMQRIQYRSGLFFAAAGLPGALLGACSTYWIPRQIFDFFCGLLMLSLGAYLLWRPGPPRADTETNPSRGPETIVYNRWLGGGLSAGIGYVSSLLGIGGGIIHVPALVRLLNFPIHQATATSHFVLALLALAGTTVHILTGAFHEGIHRTLFLSIGVVAGAQAGAACSTRIHGNGIIRGLAVALCLVGLRVLFLALPH